MAFCRIQPIPPFQPSTAATRVRRASSMHPKETTRAGSPWFFCWWKIDPRFFPLNPKPVLHVESTDADVCMYEGWTCRVRTDSLSLLLLPSSSQTCPVYRTDHSRLLFQFIHLDPASYQTMYSCFLRSFIGLLYSKYETAQLIWFTDKPLWKCCQSISIPQILKKSWKMLPKPPLRWTMFYGMRTLALQIHTLDSLT